MIFDFDNERPIYIQIVEKLKIAIVSGYYPPGTKIPSVRDLAYAAKVNPNTMQKALTELEETKLIYTDRTNGKYVTEDKKLLEKVKKDISKDIISKFIKDMNSIGISYKESINYLKELGE